MLAIFYTGDVRHNQDNAAINHQKLFDRIKELTPYKIYSFTRNDPDRGFCPYDEANQPDNAYRRGQGGAIQVWDFLRGVQRTTEPLVLRLRTDIWFTESSIDCICFELKEMLENRSDIAYFGSDWVNKVAGAVNERLSVHIDADAVIQDFAILARRSKLKDFDTTINDLDSLNPNKRRSGNKTFRYIIPLAFGAPGFREQLAIVHRVLCQIWLVRKTYKYYPSDNEVCKDYIQSYIADDKAKMGKKNLIHPHPMQDAVDWWRAQQGWGPKEIIVGEWWQWQSE